MNNTNEVLLLDIQRMSTEDGPGIRTTVFFKGCSLSCAWCHNPESIPFKREVQWIETRCIGCRACISACTEGALKDTPEGMIISRDVCNSCLSCVDSCPSGAMEARGETWSLDSLVREVLKDRVYFEKSGGGVTASGGEALLQHRFLEGFFKRLKAEGIHTALDTAGLVSTEALDRVLPYTDLVLYDIKLLDPIRHREYTGSENGAILDNLLHTAESMENGKGPKALWIRTPIIPGATDGEDDIQAIGKFISTNLGDSVSRWDLCSFNNLCRDKYRRLDRDWPFKDAPLMRKESMETLAEAAKKSGVDEQIVQWSGATMVEE